MTWIFFLSIQIPILNATCLQNTYLQPLHIPIHKLQIKEAKKYLYFCFDKPIWQKCSTHDLFYLRDKINFIIEGGAYSLLENIQEIKLPLAHRWNVHIQISRGNELTT